MEIKFIPQGNPHSQISKRKIQSSMSEHNVEKHLYLMNDALIIC